MWDCDVVWQLIIVFRRMCTVLKNYVIFVQSDRQLQSVIRIIVSLRSGASGIDVLCTMESSSSRTLKLQSSVPKIPLIGTPLEKIVGNKLPSKRDVLQCLFYHMREENLSRRESARIVLQQVVELWNKARIPVTRDQHCIAKVEGLHEKWRGLQKHTN